MGAVVLAHPKLFGLGHFTTCQNFWCILAMHLIEVPLLAYVFFVAVYAVRRLTRGTARRFVWLLGLAIVVELVMFMFDGLLLLDSFARSNSPSSEKIIYAIAMLLFLIGAFLGGGAWFRVNDYLNPPVDPRFEHPRTEGEIIQLVKKARALDVQLRVRGSGHCVPEGVGTDNDGPHINVQLDRYNQIIGWKEIKAKGEEPRLLVTVQAGCHLGVDPGDPLSNKKNSLLWQLDEENWALPDLGGVSHQTVGGFISTGSMGGAMGPSKGFSFGDAIVGIRVIDSAGQTHDLSPDDSETSEWFYAAGVSMGLLGIISTVTLECRKRYDIEGIQDTRSAEEVLRLGELRTAREVDLIVKEILPKHLFGGEYRYTRLLWWPQKGVNKVEFWKANQVEKSRKYARRKVWRMRCWWKRRYRPFVSIPRFAQKLVIYPFFRFLAKEDPLPYESTNETFVSRLLKVFVHDGVKEFHDSWHTGLPMDDQISDEDVPMVFTEMFFPLFQTDRVIKLLDEFFNARNEEEDAKGMKRTGAFAFEIYPGHESCFWLSPCFKQPSVRLDVFWFNARAVEDRHTRDTFFNQFWTLLRENRIDFRLHWGKYMPKQDSDATRKTEAKYLAAQYPENEWKKFLERRRKVDEDGIFLSKYWKERLGIEDPFPYYAPPQPLEDERKPRWVRRFWENTILSLYVSIEKLGRRAWIRILIGGLTLYFKLSDLRSSSSSEPQQSGPVLGSKTENLG